MFQNCRKAFGRVPGGVGPLRTGRITLEEALRRYQLTEEEYRSWERAFE
jgi:hypothetical protein